MRLMLGFPEEYVRKKKKWKTMDIYWVTRVSANERDKIDD